MSKVRTKLERSAFERYSELLCVMPKADALELVCGLFRAGDMRTVFFESVFGREVHDECVRLDQASGRVPWQDRYPSLAYAADELKKEGYPW